MQNRNYFYPFLSHNLVKVVRHIQFRFKNLKKDIYKWFYQVIKNILILSVKTCLNIFFETAFYFSGQKLRIIIALLRKSRKLEKEVSNWFCTVF
ncbi:hypothetical protein SAMN06265348_11829 [Pedobacter westerhofensis]|uniref:Uncharacterized protein n=1 Tax=Pedobacter westerhofensis TaxID=425512 RepID=A0A521FTQ0_9SPHI|nr:hypothetical protein SAMN06265348_11829 [Pedobacter westerhofensis]